MSAIFRHIAGHMRPGLYLLDAPVSLPSTMNFWTERDMDAGDCEPEEVGEPIVYRLHAVRILSRHEWHGYDEPIPVHLSDLQRARRIPKEPAIVFSPSDLAPLELARFLQRARRLSTPPPNDDGAIETIAPIIERRRVPAGLAAFCIHKSQPSTP